jgi:2-oxoglutarate ferredoxin oxidoreductase subunit alpha
LGTIQPSQSDYYQATKGGGNGDYDVIVLAPASVQEMADFVDLAFTLAFKYRNPAMILSDGAVGQMMERVTLPPFKPRRTEDEIYAECPWAANGRRGGRKPNIITSLELDPSVMEKRNLHLQAKYREIEANEVRFEEIGCEDAEYLIVAFGFASRIAQKVIQLLREEGIKVGLLRPITLWPFPSKEIARMSDKVKGILSLEINAGQMVNDIRLAVSNGKPVEFYGRLGGIVPTPEEVTKVFKEKLLK